MAGSSVFGELAAAFSHALKGDADAARRAIGPMTAAAGRTDEAIARFLAMLHGFLRDTDGACTWLEHAFASGNLDYPGILQAPFYRQIQSEPRFQKLLEDVRRRWEAFEV